MFLWRITSTHGDVLEAIYGAKRRIQDEILKWYACTYAFENSLLKDSIHLYLNMNILFI